MSNQPTIEGIRKNHEKLYGDVLRDQSSLVQDKDKLDAFTKEVNRLLSDITRVTVTSIEEYNWLNDVAIKWQIVFSSILNKPVTIQIAHPKILDLFPAARVLTTEEVKERVEQKALSFSNYRKAEWLTREVERLRNIPSPDEKRAKVDDWHNALMLLANDILDRKIDFVSQLRYQSYRDYVESVWLPDVKKVKAYFIWKEGRGSDNAVENYRQACKSIQDMFVDLSLKASLSDFNEPKLYLETYYLTDGKINESKPATRDAIHRKASQIYEKTGQSDAEKNWLRAKQYMQLFYENIIPAVIEKDVDSTRHVFRALQFCSDFGSHDLITNFFELVVAMYFLDRQVIQKIWHRQPQLSDI